MLRASKPWLSVILWMGFIFTMSTDLGSFDHTSRLLGLLLHWLLPHASPDTIGLLQHLLRKAGHFSEYAILALLLLRALESTLRPGTHGYKALGLALLIAAAYAATDEFHQSFVPGRTASVGDVLIDLTGAFSALGGAAVWRRGRSHSG